MVQNRIHLQRRKLLPPSKITAISKGMWSSFQAEKKKKISGNKEFIHLFCTRTDRIVTTFLKMILVQMKCAANGEMFNREKGVG
jgi:hypothetical protein